jgi:hypothetical protein
MKKRMRMLLVEDDPKDIEFVAAVKETGMFRVLGNQPPPEDAWGR